MPGKPLAAEQAKRYSDDERVKLIREFWSSGKTLADFCTTKGNPSYQVMKRLLCTSAITPESSDCASQTHNTHIAEQYNHEQFNLITNTLAQLRTRLISILEEVESLMNGLHSSRPNK